ncbi:GAP family protein [Kribbella sp. CA-247076]|uniref:GAP family protein n=1 Tax=Kribbella sp. CA-247076 TaxID=3239941 RepID=UPI003D91BB31
MGEAIGQILPLAVGVALSPVPIIAVVLMLTTPRAGSNGLAFVVGWLLGLAVIGAIVLAVADPAGASENGEPAAWASWLKLVLGLLLLLVAVRQFRGRPQAGEQASLPKWMSAIDRFGPGKAFGGGAVLAGLNPKNLLLAISAGVTVAQTGISTGQQAVAYGVFAVLGTIGVGAPVGLYVAMGRRSAELLGRLKDWMAAHNAVIMAVLCLVIGTKLIGDAITGLT